MKICGWLLSFLAVSSMMFSLLSTTSTVAAASPPNRRLYYTPNNSAKDDDLWYYRLLFVEFLMKRHRGKGAFSARDIRNFSSGTDPIPHRWGEALDALVKEGVIMKAGESSKAKPTYLPLPSGQRKYERRGDSSNYYVVKPERGSFVSM
eukprot:CAMPEP_0172303232 /NCGR_PEP_ID=MMETSP1058-20130122/4801_1 /TAXON_ID=83371 /ORGANISM="Detonula confervacea, Strain CCMP 353" /LENGTH=148 /DNA_ID=CAMNT_0013013973 /DNA_START=149 /DNA_END=598 /DNA_ORIENTATION=+